MSPRVAKQGNWTSSTLDEVLEHGLFTDGDWIETKDQDANGEVRLIQLADVGDGVFRDRSDRFMARARAEELGCTFLKSGDVLVARMPDPIGRACILPDLHRPAVAAVDVSILRPDPQRVSNEWLATAINSPQFRVQVAPKVRGSGRQRISRRNLGCLAVSVPPVAEQWLLARLLRAIDHRVSSALGALQSAETDLAQLRVLIIDSACTGALGSAPQDPWPTQSFKSLVEPLHAGNAASAIDEAVGAIPVLRSSSVRAGAVYLSDFRFVPTEKATNPRHFLEDRDILITRLSGTAEYVGNLGVVRELGKRRIQFPDRLFRTRALDPASTDFLELAFQSTSVRQQVANLIRSATGQKRLAISDVSEIRIPVPPEDERDRVVVHASRLLDVIASLGARSGSAQARLEQIRPLSRRLAQDEALVVTDSALERAESGIENLGMAATRSGKPASGLRASTEAMPATNNEYGPPGGRIMQALQEAGGRLDVGTLFKSSGFKVADGVSAGERFYEALREAEQIGLVAEDRAGEAVEVVLSSLRAS